MRWLLVGVGCVAMAGCGSPQREGSTQMITADVAEAPSRATADSEGVARAPGINLTAAPGVAFTYRYGFRLPAARVDDVQEQHAAACERLGIARCRITGMRYRLLGENNIEAALEFKLLPELARGFGKTGIAGVEQAEGTLIDAQITGTDAGAVIDRAGVDRARATDELRRLDEAILRARTGTERAELQAQRAEIARRVEGASEAAAGARASLAQTPVSFLYESGPAVRGFDSSAPITSALDTAVGSAQTTFAVLLGLLAILGPPALAIGLVLFAFFRARRWWRTRARPAQPGTAGPPAAG
ncbi:MAG: hypothetical protein JWN21_1582 [Sphingomonas bacterium]|uniref:hypothetical protein n=1 Tax=Sphingomonas bacterium TaxID=1895847 RepID=UPI0026047B3F|nr:hypothetical protein [Sphingomonas bacterium]MDB5696039.1 hypothetical protein [Sphingomonas bacterium]